MEDSNTNAAICCSVTSSLIPFLFGNKLYLMLGIFLKIITLCQGSCLLCGQSVGMVVWLRGDSVIAVVVNTFENRRLHSDKSLGDFRDIPRSAIRTKRYITEVF